jgi:hypothetical protein
VSLATAKSYPPSGANANRIAAYATDPSPRLAGGSISPHFAAEILHRGGDRLVRLALHEQLGGDLQCSQDRRPIGLDHGAGGEDLPDERSRCSCDRAGVLGRGLATDRVGLAEISTLIDVFLVLTARPPAPAAG